MPVDLLESKTQQRGTLFYDQYRYSISAYLFEASTLRSGRRYGQTIQDHAQLDSNIAWRESMLMRNINYGGSWHGNRSRPGKGFSADDVLALHETLDWILTQQGNKVVFYDNWLQIYTNDYESLATQQFWQHLQHVRLKTAEVTHAPDVVRLKNPQHTIRHYLKERWLEAGQVDLLVKFCENYANEIKLSPGLRERTAEHRRRYMTSNMFIDTSNPHIQLLFEMSFPGLLRKTYRIEPR